MVAVESLRRFSFFPAVSKRLVDVGAKVVDTTLNLSGNNLKPAANLAKKPTQYFVINAHRFAEDFDPLQDFNLRRAMSETFSKRN